MCLLCYYKFRNEEYVPHLLLQHYYHRVNNLRKQTDNEQVRRAGGALSEVDCATRIRRLKHTSTSTYLVTCATSP